MYLHMCVYTEYCMQWIDRLPVWPIYRFQSHDLRTDLDDKTVDVDGK